MNWIPADEQMPELGVRVLTFAPERYFSVSIHSFHHEGSYDWWIADGDGNYPVADSIVTHWMPLPLEVE